MHVLINSDEMGIKSYAWPVEAGFNGQYDIQYRYPAAETARCVGHGASEKCGCLGHITIDSTGNCPRSISYFCRVEVKTVGDLL